MDDSREYYFSDVLLCTAPDGKNFTCQKFNSFLEANEYFKKNFTRTQELKSTMLRSCRFIPTSLREWKVNRDLEKLFNPKFKTKIPYFNYPYT